MANLDEATVKKLQTFYQVLLDALKEKFGSRLQTVVLFGSQARLEAHSESDHDFFIVVAGLPQEPVRRQRVVRLALLPVLPQLSDNINIVAKTPSELDANLTPLMLDVCVDGICLFGCDYFKKYQQQCQAALFESGMQRKQMGGKWMWLSPHGPGRTWELSWEGSGAGR